MSGMLVLGLCACGVAPVALPSFSTVAFQTYFGLGRLVRGVSPLGTGRLMHLVVAYGLQVADEDAERLNHSYQLFDAAMCELAVVSGGQPRIMAGDFNLEPTKIPRLLKGISARLGGCCTGWVLG